MKPDTTTMLRLENVSRSYSGRQVLQNISFSVNAGEFVAVVGPSGCGKTTLLRLLGGHETHDTGTLERCAHTRTIYQQGGLLPWKTALENVAMGLLHIEKSNGKRITLANEMLGSVGMDGYQESYPHQLSGGMRQRVELARALVSGSEILLMDEPFSALDFLTRLKMRSELIRLLKDKEQTVIFVTHDVEEAAQLATRIILLTRRPAAIACEITLPEMERPRSLSHPVVIDTAEKMLNVLGMHV